jgi:hypothetical protein
VVSNDFDLTLEECRRSFDRARMLFELGEATERCRTNEGIALELCDLGVGRPRRLRIARGLCAQRRVVDRMEAERTTGSSRFLEAASA